MAMTWFGLVFLSCLIKPDLTYGASAIPGEDQGGFFYALGHLHPAAYVVLFVILVLSVANLVFQYGLSAFFSPLSFLFSLKRRREGDVEPRPLLKRLNGLGLDARLRDRPLRVGPSGRRGGERADAVLSVRQIPKIGYRAAAAPTPLDGVNHPMPSFSSPPFVESGAPRLVTTGQEKKPSAEFKFSAAVDLPSREEMERRDKTQLVVSGSVLGQDGKGIGSVIVYLTDGEGNRLGQSCRSAADTGEFRVQINESGRYLVKGYKRGFVMESAEPLVIPIESGRIEGYTFRMIPEGCAIMGRVVLEETGEGMADCEVRCVCRMPESSRSAMTGASGQFRIQGVPMNSECHLEVLEKGGTLLTRSARFQTVQKKECYVEIKLASGGQTTKDTPLGPSDPVTDPIDQAQGPNSSPDNQFHTS